MRRITRHDSEKADELLIRLEGDIEQTKHHLANLIDFAVDYFKELKRKYGEGKERKTEIKHFDNIVASKVAVANTKLYVDRAEGFIGYGLRKSDSEFVADCSDIDNIIVIREDGTLIVSKITAKHFVGKNILHVGVWKKKDERTIYNLIYRDGPAGGKTYMKRFAVTSITRDKEYHLGKGTKGSKVLYLSANPNGEAETVQVILRAQAKVKKLKLDLDFSELAIKGRAAGGNVLTKYAVNKIFMKDAGVSTLGARKVWYDDTVQRLNSEERGELLGDFKAEDKILTVYQSGEYRLTGFGLSNRFDEDMILIEKWNPNKPLSAVYFDGDKKQYYIKRFLVEGSEKKTSFITDHEESILEVVSSDWLPQIQINFSKIKGKEREPEQINISEFITVKGYKALGNRLTTHKVKSIDTLESLPYEEEIEEEEPVGNIAEVEEENLDEIEPVKPAQEESVGEKPRPTKEEPKKNKPSSTEPIEPVADTPLKR